MNARLLGPDVGADVASSQLDSALNAVRLVAVRLGNDELHTASGQHLYTVLYTTPDVHCIRAIRIRYDTIRRRYDTVLNSFGSFRCGFILHPAEQQIHRKSNHAVKFEHQGRF